MVWNDETVVWLRHAWAHGARMYALYAYDAEARTLEYAGILRRVPGIVIADRKPVSSRDNHRK